MHSTIQAFSAFFRPSLFVVTLFFLFPLIAQAATEIPPGTYHRGMHFTEAGSPYIIDELTYFRNGVLIFDGNVVFKFKTPLSSLLVHGDVTVENNATKDKPIYFTSYKDDSLAGDTNGDGNATTPAPGDWGKVSLACGGTPQEDNFSYMRVYYGGASEVAMQICYISYGTSPQSFILEYIEVAHNLNGLTMAVSEHSVLFQNSSIHDNVNYGAQPLLNFPFPIARHNWWGSVNGPRSQDNPTGDGDSVLGSIITVPFLTEDPLPVATSAECCSSVLFLPGFEGSTLIDGANPSNTLWPPTLFSVADDLSNLAFDETGTPVKENVQVNGILNTFYGVSIYDGFSSFMNSLVSSTTMQVKEWKPFAYDWRYSPGTVLTNGVETPGGNVDLIETAEKLARDSYTGRITIVTHSMGGLLGKALIKALEEKGKAGIVDTFVMVGSPQLGTPQAATALLHGEGADISWGAVALVNKKYTRALGRTLENAYNILPSERYFSEVIDSPIIFSTSTALTQNWRNTWGTNITNINEFFSFLTGIAHGLSVRNRPYFDSINEPEILKPSLLSEASSFHQNFDNFAFPSNIQVIQVAGWGLPTIKGLEYTEDDGLLDYRPLFTTEGDQTVAYPSALSSVGEKYYFNLDAYNDSHPDTQHANILNSEGILNAIQTILNQNDLTTDHFFVTEKPNPLSVQDKLLIGVYSPVNITAYDSSERFTGITSGQDQNADIQFITQNIPGSTYFSFGEGKYVMLPKNDSYTFVFEGTAEGKATFDVQTFSNNALHTLATYSSVPISTTTRAVLHIDGDSPPRNIEIDSDGDGAVDSVMYPDSHVLTLQELINALKNKITTLDIKLQLKNYLLIKVKKIESKVVKQKNKQILLPIVNLQVQLIQNKIRGKLSDSDVQEITYLLDQVEKAI